MSTARALRALVATGALCLLSSVALAQDYTVTTVAPGSNDTALYVTPPSTKTNLGMSDDSTAAVTLTFDFPYYGNTYRNISVSSNGFIQINPQRAVNACCSGSVLGPGNNRADSVVAIVWDDLNPPGTGGAVTHFTANNPQDSTEKVWYLTYEGVPRCCSRGSVWAQIQLHEKMARSSSRTVIRPGIGRRRASATWRASRRSGPTRAS